MIDSCRGTLNPIRRHAAHAPLEVQQPTWAQSEYSQETLAILLAGSWLANNQHECKKVEEIVGLPYSELEKKLNDLTLMDDAPVRRVGNVWQCVSRQGSWRLLSQNINESVIERFCQASKDILGATHSLIYGSANKHRIIDDRMVKRVIAGELT